MAEKLAVSVDDRAQKAFNKVKRDIKALQEENEKLKKQHGVYEIERLKHDFDSLKRNYELELSRLRRRIEDCKCEENSKKIEELEQECRKNKLKNSQKEEKEEEPVKEEKKQDVEEKISRWNNLDDSKEEKHKTRGYFGWMFKGDKKLDNIKEVQ